MKKRRKTKIHEFFMGMMEDPQKIVAFRTNPSKMVRDSDLPEKHKETILSGDATRIKAAVDAELGPESPKSCWVWVF